MARPGRLELPTLCLEGRRSIQLSYGRIGYLDSKSFIGAKNTILGVLSGYQKGSGATMGKYTYRLRDAPARTASFWLLTFEMLSSTARRMRIR